MLKILESFQGQALCHDLHSMTGPRPNSPLLLPFIICSPTKHCLSKLNVAIHGHLARDPRISSAMSNLFLLEILQS